MEEELESGDSPALRALEVDVFVSDRGKDFAAALGAADEDVEASLAAILDERSKVHGELAQGVAAVADGNEHHIALVALHALETLDEERLVGMRREEGFGFGMLAAQQLERIGDGA